MVVTRIFLRNFCNYQVKRHGNTMLMDTMRKIIPEKQSYFADWKKKNAQKIIMEKITISQIFGMKQIKAMICETSLLHPYQGITFRGLSIPEVTDKIPKITSAKSGNGTLKQPLPEGVLWLFLTSEIPTEEQVKAVSEDLLNRAKIPEETAKLIDSFPKEMHPMVQLSSAVLSLSPYSHFRKAHENGVSKQNLWEPCLEDGLDLIAKIIVIAARIFRRRYGKKAAPGIQDCKDISSRFCRELGFTSDDFDEMMRMYLTIHSDHESGNVSSHASHLVASTLSDPFMAYSAGINGLGGPLHGMANQEVLEWIKKLDKSLAGKEIVAEDVIAYVKKTLSKGSVIPGFGHAVLRVTDPRYTLQQKFSENYLDSSDRLYKIVKILYKVVPSILADLGKVKNPHPNVDAHSGVILNHMGMSQSDFYTVLFAVSRSIGVMSSMAISRAYGLPIERPKSVTTEWITKNIL